jgi:isorenieratene synthase
MSCFRGDLGTHQIDPLAAALRARGGRILRNAKAVDVERDGERIFAVRVVPTSPRDAAPEVLAAPARLSCDAVVGATDIPGFQRWLLPGLADAPSIRGASNLDAVGSVTTRVVTSRPVRADDPQMGIFSGAFETLDTYFLLSRYQDEFIEFRRRTGGEVIEVHSYLASRELEASSPAVRALRSAVVRAWPGRRQDRSHRIRSEQRTFDKWASGTRDFNRMRTEVPNLVLWS